MSVRTLRKKSQGWDEELGDKENPFSTNKVTGHSLNYPIIGTCKPTIVCSDRCYFAKGPSAWDASLRKQWRLHTSTTNDPDRTAGLIVAWTARLKLSFVRWNGGGDLFRKSVECINTAAPLMPDVPQWIVTRIPDLASLIEPGPNVYLHFSIDRSSLGRLDEFKPRAGLKWFWSYQCDKDETAPPHPDVAPVIFRDGYDLRGSQAGPNDCPLNTSDSIVGACGACRRCFNGDAVSRAKECRI